MNTLPDTNACGHGRMSGIGGLLALCLLCSCSKNLESGSTSRSPGAKDPEIALENNIQKLFGEINDQQREVNTLIRGAGPNLTPETRNKARAARYEFYAADKYSEALRAAQTHIKSKLATITGIPATNSPAQTNRSVTSATPDENGLESNLKASLMAVRAATEELAMTDSSATNNRVEGETQTPAVEPYSPEEYTVALRLVAMMMERKVQGLQAEATFYRNLLGLDSDNVPIQKK